MLDLKKCKEILHKDKQETFSDEDVMKIREFLYKMAKIVIETKTVKSDEK